MIKRILSAVGAVVFIAATAACSTVSTASDEQGLHYGGGPFTSKSFKNCTAPANKDFDAMGNSHYIYPHGQRTFSFTGQAGSEHNPIAVTTEEGQEVDVPGFLTFTMTDNCALLRKYHEQIGLKYRAYDTDGWNAFLNDYVYTPLNSALNKAAQDIKPTQDTPAWRRLYTSTQVQSDFAKDVQASLPGLITTALGDDYIKIDSVSISKPIVSDELRESIQATQVAINDNKAQKAKNAKVRTQYDTIKDCLATGLDKQSCTLIFLQQSGANIPFLPVPQGGAVNYNQNTPAPSN